MDKTNVNTKKTFRHFLKTFLVLVFGIYVINFNISNIKIIQTENNITNQYNPINKAQNKITKTIK